ncbi:hypothetical protein P0Y35_11605 [Kiritimatiellaeota bacterium B1221]|nr:hypothetical protein [Kiritimatiellaeota bacterium B1221]
MKKSLPAHIAAGLLGLAFIAFGLMVLLGLGPAAEAPPEGSYPALFMGAFAPSGYLTFVKVLEVVGGILVILPFTRNFGLLVLGPILVNIVAYHCFIMGGAGLFSPVILILWGLAFFVLWSERKAFAGLIGK